MSSLSSPLLHIPTKQTDEVDFGPSFRAYIQSVYQENPDKYRSEIAHLNRLRQDTRGAGKDLTGRDILYRYYGQLELLDLRFPIDEKNVKVLFTWQDAFSSKPISQYSVAYEKACTIFNIAATCSSIAALQNRFETSGLKMAFNYFQAAAGLFSYINDNFLHAPSIDLSRDSIRALVDLTLAQAQECFLEKVVMEKKRGLLVAKLAAQAARQYTVTLEALGHVSLKGQFEKAWPELVKVKAKHFQALSFYHKALQLETENKYGEIVVYVTQAETYAKDAQKLAMSFQSSFPTFTTSSLSNSSDSGKSTTVAISLVEATRVSLTTITDHKNRATKDNDIIYHAPVPNLDTLPPIDKLAAVKPITFAEVCAGGAADIPKIIGPDIFATLVPLSVHESNSVYSEEKDKLLRSEKERALNADGELQASLESMDLIPLLDRLKRFVKGVNTLDGSVYLPDEVKAWNQDIKIAEGGASGQSRTEELVSTLEGAKQKVREALDEIGRSLDKEQSACEAMRVKYIDSWTQEPSGRLTSSLRGDLRRHRESFDQAASTDSALLQQVADCQRETADLGRHLEELESIFTEMILSDGSIPHKNTESNLMDDDGAAVAHGNKGLNVLGEQLVIEKLDQLLSRLRSLKKERTEIIDELRHKTQQDDIAGLLLLNKNKEAQVFASELAKFKPIQARLTANLHSHQQMLQELCNEYDRLRESSIGLKALEGQDRRKAKIVADWRESYFRWKEIRNALNRGIQFYSGLSKQVEELTESVVNFVQKRDNERSQLIRKIEDDQAEIGQKALREQLRRLSVTSSSPTYQGPLSSSSTVVGPSTTFPPPSSSMPVAPPMVGNLIPPAPIQAYTPNNVSYSPVVNQPSISRLTSNPISQPPYSYHTLSSGRPTTGPPPPIAPNPYTSYNAPAPSRTPSSSYNQVPDSHVYNPSRPNHPSNTPPSQSILQYPNHYSYPAQNNLPQAQYHTLPPSSQPSSISPLYISSLPRPNSTHVQSGSMPAPPSQSATGYGSDQHAISSIPYSSHPTVGNQSYGVPSSSYGSYSKSSIPPSIQVGQAPAQQGYAPPLATTGYRPQPLAQPPSWQQGYHNPEQPPPSQAYLQAAHPMDNTASHHYGGNNPYGYSIQQLPTPYNAPPPPSQYEYSQPAPPSEQQYGYNAPRNNSVAPSQQQQQQQGWRPPSLMD